MGTKMKIPLKIAGAFTLVLVLCALCSVADAQNVPLCYSLSTGKSNRPDNCWWRFPDQHDNGVTFVSSLRLGVGRGLEQRTICSNGTKRLASTVTAKVDIAAGARPDLQWIEILQEASNTETDGDF